MTLTSARWNSMTVPCPRLVACLGCEKMGPTTVLDGSPIKEETTECLKSLDARHWWMNESPHATRESWPAAWQTERCIVGSEGCCSRDTSLQTLWGQKPCTFEISTVSTCFFQQSWREGPRRMTQWNGKLLLHFFFVPPCLGLGLAHLVHSQGDISDILRYLLRRRMAIKCQKLQFSEKTAVFGEGSLRAPHVLWFARCSNYTINYYQRINGLSCRSWILIVFHDSHLYLVLDIHEMHEVILALNDGLLEFPIEITNLPFATCHLPIRISRGQPCPWWWTSCEPTSRKAGHRNDLGLSIIIVSNSFSLSWRDPCIFGGITWNHFVSLYTKRHSKM